MVWFRDISRLRAANDRTDSSDTSFGAHAVDR
jgi:hypothetical protein